MKIEACECLYRQSYQIKSKLKLVNCKIKKITLFLCLLCSINSFEICNDIEGCFCGEEYISCSQAQNPIFSYDYSIKIVRIEYGYLQNIYNIVESFPNLECLRLIDVAFLIVDHWHLLQKM